MNSYIQHKVLLICIYMIKNTLYYYIMYFNSGKNFFIFVISFFVYLFVNLFENLIHYNIGKFSNKKTKLELPSKKDWIKIVVVMCVFALLQGLLTYYFTYFFI
jgi:hypothetical protein